MADAAASSCLTRYVYLNEIILGVWIYKGEVNKKFNLDFLIIFQV